MSTAAPSPGSPTATRSHVAPLSVQDVLEVHQLIAEVAFAFDSPEFATVLPRFVTPDVTYENPGRVHLTSARDLVDTLSAMTDRAVSHHVSTTVVEPAGPDAATCRSKVITIRTGGRQDVAEFVDTVRREPGGAWRLAHRLVRPLA